MKDEELYKKEEINSQKINIDVLPLLSKLYHKKLVVIIVTIIFIIVGIINAFTSDRDYTASEVVVPEQEQDMKSSLMNSLSSFMDRHQLQGLTKELTMLPFFQRWQPVNHSLPHY